MANKQEPRIGYFIRGECGSEGRIGPDIGPFPDYIQMMYDIITVGPDGGEIGAYYTKDEGYLFNEDGFPVSGWSFFSPYDKEKVFYSDIIIYALVLEEGQEMIRVPG